MAANFVAYDRIAQMFRGFSLTEIKKMSVPERKFWADLVMWRNNQSGE